MFHKNIDLSVCSNARGLERTTWRKLPLFKVPRFELWTAVRIICRAVFDQILRIFIIYSLIVSYFSPWWFIVFKVLNLWQRCQTVTPSLQVHFHCAIMISSCINLESDLMLRYWTRQHPHHTSNTPLITWPMTVILYLIPATDFQATFECYLLAVSFMIAWACNPL